MSKATLILSVDTATPNGGVCLFKTKHELASIAADAKLSHSNTLLRDIRSVLDSAEVTLSDIDVFAAACGPGSFTGLRIGLATIKALAATLGRPTVGIPTLHAIARSAGKSSATVSLVPAGRGELFVQLLSVTNDNEITELDQAAHLPPDAVIDRYSEIPELIWAGPGAHTYEDKLRVCASASHFSWNESTGGWTLAPAIGNLATHVAALAAFRYESGVTESPDELHALYVRPSDPELKVGRA